MNNSFDNIQSDEFATQHEEMQEVWAELEKIEQQERDEEIPEGHEDFGWGEWGFFAEAE